MIIDNFKYFRGHQNDNETPQDVLENQINLSVEYFHNSIINGINNRVIRKFLEKEINPNYYGTINIT